MYSNVGESLQGITLIYRVERWYSIEDGSGGLWEGGAAAEQIRKGEGSTMKNANRIPETFQTDAEYRQWMERWQQEAREATIEGFKLNRKLNGMTQTELGRKAGISQPNITRFESGSYNPSLDFMVKIAAAMGKRVQITLVDE